jgi:hypothetical protein
MLCNMCHAGFIILAALLEYLAMASLIPRQHQQHKSMHQLNRISFILGRGWLPVAGKPTLKHPEFLSCTVPHRNVFISLRA